MGIKVFLVLNGKATTYPWEKAAGKLDIDANSCFPFKNAVSIVNSHKTYQ